MAIIEERYHFVVAPGAVFVLRPVPYGQRRIYDRCIKSQLRSISSAGVGNGHQLIVSGNS
jgi:hypothetical protein